MFFLKEVHTKEPIPSKTYQKQSSSGTMHTPSFDGKYNPTTPFLDSELLS
jgi:hypothetical protein